MSAAGMVKMSLAVGVTQVALATWVTDIFETRFLRLKVSLETALRLQALAHSDPVSFLPSRRRR